MAPRRKKIAVGNALMCDYAAKGDRSKHTLVNVYSGNVLFETLPVDFSFGLYIEILDYEPTEENAVMGVLLKLDGVEIARLGAVSKRGTGTILIPNIQMHIEANATMEVVLSAPGYLNTVALSKRLYERASPEGASPTA